MRELANKVRAILRPDMARDYDSPAGAPLPVRFPWEAKRLELWRKDFNREFPRSHDEATAYSVLIIVPYAEQEAYEEACREWIERSSKGRWCFFNGFGNGTWLVNNPDRTKAQTYSFERTEDAALFKLFHVDLLPDDR